MPSTPNRSTSEADLNAFNDQMRRSPDYQAFLESIGQGHGAPTRLSRSQQGQLEAYLKSKGTPLPGGMHIDQAGNINQKNRLARNTAIAAGMAAGGYFAAPAIAGALGGGAAAGGAGAAGAAGAAGGAAIPAAVAGIPAGISIGGATALGGGALGAAGLGAAGAAGGLGTMAGGAGAAGGAGTLANLAKYSQIAGQMGSVLGKQQEGAAAGRVQQSLANDRADRNAVDLYGTEQGAQNQAGQLDLQRKGFETNNRGALAKLALIGQLLGGGMKPTQISTPGIQSSTLQGGLLRSLLSNPEALAAMKTMGGQAGTAQNTPLQFQGGQILTPPKLTRPMDVDNGGTLATLANIAQIAGTISPYLRGGR